MPNLANSDTSLTKIIKIVNRLFVVNCNIFSLSFSVVGIAWHGLTNQGYGNGARLVVTGSGRHAFGFGLVKTQFRTCNCPAAFAIKLSASLKGKLCNHMAGRAIATTLPCIKLCQ